MGDDGGGLLIGPDGVAPSRMVNVCLCYLPLHHKSSEEFLLAPADLGGPGKSGVKRLCVLFWKENLWDRWHSFYLVDAVPVTRPTTFKY